MKCIPVLLKQAANQLESGGESGKSFFLQFSDYQMNGDAQVLRTVKKRQTLFTHLFPVSFLGFVELGFWFTIYENFYLLHGRIVRKIGTPRAFRRLRGQQ